MDYEPPEWQPDPLWEQAENEAAAELESIAEDFDDETYNQMLRTATEAAYKRLQQDMQEELAYLDTLTPAQRQAYLDNDGHLPPDDDYIDLKLDITPRAVWGIVRRIPSTYWQHYTALRQRHDRLTAAQIAFSMVKLMVKFSLSP